MILEVALVQSMLQSSYYISMQNNSSEHFYMWQFTFQNKNKHKNLSFMTTKQQALGKVLA